MYPLFISFSDSFRSTSSAKLFETVRSIDTVARLGGDEFVIVLSELESDLQAMLIANKIMQLFEQPVLLKGQEFFVAGSIGIAIFPRDGEGVSQLLSNADAAMYRSKDLGRKQICFYSPEMNDKLLGRLTLENDLRRAIKKEEFEKRLRLQPKGGGAGFTWSNARKLTQYMEKLIAQGVPISTE